MSDDRLLDLYSFLHGQGFELFTLPPRRNVPPPAGFTDPDWKGITPAQVRKEASRGRNVACRVPRGAAVVDTDGPESEAKLLLYALGTHETLTVETPRGRHYYFATTHLDQTQTKGDGIDVRAQGKGYVLLPPSVVDEHVYRTKAPPPGGPPWGYALPLHAPFVLSRLSGYEVEQISRLARPRRAQKRTGRARGPKRVREARAAGKSAHDEARAGIWKHVRYGRAWTESIREEYVAALMEGGERDAKTARDEIDRLYEGAVKKDEDAGQAPVETPPGLTDDEWNEAVAAARQEHPPVVEAGKRGWKAPFAPAYPHGADAPGQGWFRNHLEAAMCFALDDPKARDGQVRLLLSRSGQRGFQGAHLVEWSEDEGWAPSTAPFARVNQAGIRGYVTQEHKDDPFGGKTQVKWRHLRKEAGSPGYALNVVKQFAAVEGLGAFEDEFDARPDLMGLPGGKALHLADGTMCSNAGYLLLLRAGAVPCAEPSGRLEGLLRRAFPNDAVRKLFVLELARSAWGVPRSKRMVVLLGASNAGKSSLMTCIRNAFGDYAGLLPAAAVVRSRGGQFGFSSESAIAQLAWARLGIVGDLPEGADGERWWHVGNIADATGGEGFEGRRIRQDTVRLALRIFVCLNALPRLPETIEMQRLLLTRLLVLPFADMALTPAEREWLVGTEAAAEMMATVQKWAPEGVRLGSDLPLPQACAELLEAYAAGE